MIHFLVIQSLYELGKTDSSHTACADCLLLYLHTKTFFSPTEYSTVQGDFLAIHGYDIPCSCAETYKLYRGRPRKTTVSTPSSTSSLTSTSTSTSSSSPFMTSENQHWLGQPVQKSKEAIRWDSKTDEEKLAESNHVLSLLQKTYNSPYVWGQAVMWFKQTVNDPCAR